jgi:hypothetical protein
MGELSVMSMLGVTEAAERLGVSTRQVQRLVASGELSHVARGYVDASSVDRLLAVRSGGRTRAWSEETAWGAVALLSGLDASWLGESQRSRLRRRLREISVEELVARARDRAVVRRYAGHRSAVGRVRAATVSTHVAARRLGLADANAVDVYLSADTVDEVARGHGLVADAGGAFTLRATTMDMEVVANVVRAGDVLAALDLAESLDVRERSAGYERSKSSWRRSVADRPIIEVPTPPGGWGDPLPNVAEIEAVLPHQEWTLIGGLMTQLHAIHRGIDAIRPTNDVDIVLHVETTRGVAARTASALESLGYQLTPSIDDRNNTVHRFRRGDSTVDLVASATDVVDVLVADHAVPDRHP